MKCKKIPGSLMIDETNIQLLGAKIVAIATMAVEMHLQKADVPSPVGRVSSAQIAPIGGTDPGEGVMDDE